MVTGKTKEKNFLKKNVDILSRTHLFLKILHLLTHILKIQCHMNLNKFCQIVSSCFSVCYLVNRTLFNLSRVTVKIFIMLQNTYISNKCYSFERSIHERTLLLKIQLCHHRRKYIVKTKSYFLNCNILTQWNYIEASQTDFSLGFYLPCFYVIRTAILGPITKPSSQAPSSPARPLIGSFV